MREFERLKLLGASRETQPPSCVFKRYSTFIDGVDVIDITKFPDKRGINTEGYRVDKMAQIGLPLTLLQENITFTTEPAVFRGFHYQKPHGQTKAVQVLQGSGIDLVCDIRLGSYTFGQTGWIELNEDNLTMLYINKDLAHAFLTIIPKTVLVYKIGDYYYDPENAKGITPFCRMLHIDWSLWGIEKPNMTDRDQSYPTIEQAIDISGYLPEIGHKT